MKRIFITLSVLSILSTKIISQTLETFFPTNDLMRIGAYYYPEHWDSNQWERDIKNMAELGFEFTHFGEFAWPFMEPEEGKFDFSWLDRNVELAEKYGLKVIMCTPTPCPPIWLGQKYPELFLQDDHYQSREHGSRGNYSTSNDIFWDYTEKIVTELAKRYGNHPAVWGWQLDNEPGAPEDYSPAAQQKFRGWLKEKYKTIEGLNDAWGNRFWGVVYQNFDQINIPIRRFLYGLSPSALVDYKRFIADQQADFLDFQTNTLRKYISKKQWITTNYIANITSADPRRTDVVDFSSYTRYPVDGGGYNLGDQGFRMGNPSTMDFANDFYRPMDGKTGIMELQPGQVNWAQINPQPAPGAVRMWLWHAYSGGSNFACTYRFRQPLYGSEQYHYGIVGTDGVTPSPGGKEYAQVAREMKTLREIYNPKAAAPKEYAAKKTAILWSHDNNWDIEFQKRTRQWWMHGHVERYQSIVKSLGGPVDFICESTELSGYPFVIIPAYQLVDDALIQKWTDYAKEGGNLIITCRTGHKDRNGHLFEAPYGNMISGLIGADIEKYDLLLENVEAYIEMGGEKYAWTTWGDVLAPYDGTSILAIYADQFYKGEAAAITRTLGKGSVTYIGTHTKTGEFEKKIVSKVFSDKGKFIKNYPEGIIVQWRDGFWVAVNYTSKSYELPLPKNADILIGNKIIPSPGVTVWTEK